MKNVWPKLLVVLAVLLALVMIPATTTADSPDGTLTLENKNPSTWAVISDTTVGVLSFYTSGASFVFGFVASGLEPDIEYSLIYYANPWPGNNPGKLIGVGTSDSSGGLTIAGSPDLGMNLPTPPDSNMVVNHCVPPDNYATCYGAKIWLVPSSCYTEPSITSWQPTRFLFETDLINYTDTDVSGVSGGSVATTTTITEPVATIGLTVSPPSIGFGSVDVGSCSTGWDITLTNAGNVPIKVTATTSAGFYTDCLQISSDGGVTWASANGWVSATIPTPTGSFVTIKTRVCPTIAYSGIITGSVSFVASFAP